MAQKFDYRKYISENKFSLNETKQQLSEVKLKNVKTADEARNQAMDWQSEFSSKSMSWEDVIKAGNHFRKLAKKFGLTDEFEENGII